MKRYRVHYRAVNARRITTERRSIIDAATSDHEYDASGKVINFFFSLTDSRLNHLREKPRTSII